MGQAKQRGTREERVIQAIQKRFNSPNLNLITVEDICRDYDIPLDSKAVGYIVSVESLNSFLSAYHVADGNVITNVTTHPINAMVFQDFDTVAPIARAIAKDQKTDICFLFDTNYQLEVIPIISVERPNHSNRKIS